MHVEVEAVGSLPVFGASTRHILKRTVPGISGRN